MLNVFRSRRWRVLGSLAVSLVLSAGGVSSAGLIDPAHLPTVKLEAVGATNAWNFAPPASSFAPSANGGYALQTPGQGNNVCGGRANITVSGLQFDPDPFVLNNILVTNTTATTQIYSVTVGLPTSFGAPNQISGNITTSVIEGSNNTVTISTVPTQSLYKAQIDFATVQTLQNDPFSLTTGTSTSGSASFGPIGSAIPVVNNIGIVLTFSLTAGDSAAVLSRFDVVPEPTSLALIGGALVLTTIRRRSR